MWIGLAVTLVTGAIAGFVLATIVRELTRKRRLGSHAKRISGVVSSAKVPHSKGGRIELLYAFANPEGVVIEAKAKDFWDNPAGTPPPMPGTPLVIMYVNDRHYEVL
jgi:hypothetical protein